MHRFVRLVLFAALACGSLLRPGPVLAAEPAADAASASRASLAKSILDSHRITLATTHVSGVHDNATARQNIVATSEGRAAHRSCYGTAPCGTVRLSVAMLRSMLEMRKHFTFRVSEIAGGSHTPRSLHYAGRAFDVDVLDGQAVSASNPHVRAFEARCRVLGATEVLGPGDPGHATHLHCAW